MTQNDTAVYAPPTALGPSITVREAQQAVLRICADTEFSTPQPHAWTYIIMSVAAAISAMRHFIHSISYPRYRPYLAVVRVPAQLKVNARALGLFKMIRLVVHKYGIPSPVNAFHQHAKALAAVVVRSSRPIITKSPSVATLSRNNVIPARRMKSADLSMPA